LVVAIVTWTKLSDHFSDDCWALSDAAYRLHVETIIRLRRRGYRFKDIAGHLGMSVSGVSDAIRRIQDGRPGRDPRD
jgi:hypothetical protein